MEQKHEKLIEELHGKGCAGCLKKQINGCKYLFEGTYCSSLLHRAAKEVSELAQELEKTRAQLEAAQKWRNDDGSILCPYCRTTMRMIPAWRKTIPDMGGFVWSARGKCPACGSITPETHGRTAKEANAAAYDAAQWGRVLQKDDGDSKEKTRNDLVDAWNRRVNDENT